MNERIVTLIWKTTILIWIVCPVNTYVVIENKISAGAAWHFENAFVRFAGVLLLNSAFSLTMWSFATMATAVILYASMISGWLRELKW